MFEYLLLHPAALAWFGNALLVVVVCARVIMRRPATGVALAWMVLTLALPFAGAAIYLLIGERRVGRSRARRMEKLRTDFRKITDAAVRKGLTDVDWSRHPRAAVELNQVGKTLIGSPTVSGSRFQFYSDTQEILEALVRDIDSAQNSVLMEFYIWNAGGSADHVLEALMRAAGRGVHCCVLIDALGARSWWHSDQPGRLRGAGVDVRPALPAGVFHTLVGRTDLRLHRKIVIIDGQAAWTGSMNLVDPRYFKQDSGVGQWVDAMVRGEGSVVVLLAATMIGDWALESAEPISEQIARHRLQLVEPAGEADVQVVPSGPGQSGDTLLQMILSLVNLSSEELVLTTPYLVPDESLLRALCGAAARGVRVILIVPLKVDSLLTRYASRSYYDDLLAFGVEIHLYRGGLLHTKSITSDGRVSMFGTVNLDMRSMWLNYEVALFVYDTDFTSRLRALQQTYLDDSDRLDAATWAERPSSHRFLENSLRLVSPLL